MQKRIDDNEFIDSHVFYDNMRKFICAEEVIEGLDKIDKNVEKKIDIDFKAWHVQLDKYKNENPTNLEKHIHEVWYFISAANKRITETDVEVVNLIIKKNVPIAIVMTQIDNVDEDELNELCKVINSDFENIKYFTVCVTDNEEIAEAVKPYNQKKQLLEWANDNLTDSLKEGFIISVYNNLEMVKKYVNKKIIPIYDPGCIT